MVFFNKAIIEKICKVQCSLNLALEALVALKVNLTQVNEK